MLTILVLYQRSCGAMDNASDYESEDCRFDSCQDRYLFFQGMKGNVIKFYGWIQKGL